MAIDFSKLRKLLHAKTAEMKASLTAGNTAAGGFFAADKSDIIPGHDTAFFVASSTVIWRYNADEDGWIQVAASGIAGTAAGSAGMCGKFRAMSAPGGVQTLTASAAGTTTTIPTNLTILQSLKGQRVRIVEGPGAGYDGLILHNTLGANAVITLATAASAAISTATKFNLFGGSLWFFNAGTVAVGFAVYDIITNAWTQRSVAGLPTAWGIDAQLIGTGSASSNGGLGFVNGQATAGAGSTLTDTNKTWPVNGWTNFQVRITDGTGKGQIRTIASNTAVGLNVTVAWATVPDNTSVYVIEGNDDYLYLGGNAAVALYRYSISGNAWSTLAPAAARAGAPGGGCTFDWIDSDPEWQETSPGIYGNHYTTAIIRQNGRYIYSFRGGGSNILEVYDIAANTWISGVAYAGQMETFTTGSCSTDMDGNIYIQKENTGRIYRFDVSANRMLPLFLSPMPQGAAVAGNKMMIQTLKDTGTGRWLYTLGHTRSELIRFFLV